MDREITFETLPQAVTFLIAEVEKLRNLLEQSHHPVTTKRLPINIDDACKLVMKAKPTIYALVRQGLIPCYKSGQKLYFYEDELLEWIASGRKKNIAATKAQIEADMQRTVRHKPQKRIF